MQEIWVRNVSEALAIGKDALESSGIEVETRNGLALEFPGPVVTTYTHSRERVLFYPERDANPYFHLMESLWMLAGRNDVEFIQNYNKRMVEYSDDGITSHGAYGYRWRTWFGKDQLEIAIFRLTTYPNDRRVVINMWDPIQDLHRSNGGKDHPCNTQIFFWKRKSELHMTVVNRSNDMIWGAYGANAVHMSILQEYMASMTGCKVGDYYQFSNNLHAYVEPLKKLDGMQIDREPYLTIADDGLSYSSPPIVSDPSCFDEELQKWFIDEDLFNYKNEFLGKTAAMMRKSWHMWKQKNMSSAFKYAFKIEDRAWRKACVEWLKRRKK
tara:strand:+ start:973 stop:1950 length:978 start_codon:yes stop_codon:yes gene_type:complete